MAPARFDNAADTIAHAVGLESSPAHRPLFICMWYSDGLCAEVPVGGEAGAAAATEQAVREALHMALKRTDEGRCRPVCITIWFSDRCCIQRGWPASFSGPSTRTETLSQCKQDIRGVLQAVGHRLTTTGLLREVGARELHWGESTLKRALAEMVRDGELNNRSDVRPRGYGLPGW